MKSTLKTTAALALLATVSVMSAAQPSSSQRAVDPRTLDIAGVKTGMDYEEATAAVMRHFRVTRDALMPETSPRESLVTRTRLPTYFTYENNGVKLIVHFEDRVRGEKNRPKAVSHVIYEIPWSQANVSAMANAALSKYGEQSNAPTTLPMEWCGKPINPSMGCFSLERQATLKLMHVKMELIDPAWQQARIEFVQASQARRPSF